MKSNPSIKEQIDAVIETIIPIHTYDNQIVKEAKVFARKEAQEAITALFLESLPIRAQIMPAGEEAVKGDNLFTEGWNGAIEITAGKLQTNQEGGE